MLRWFKRLTVVVGLAFGLAALVCAVVLGPYVRDDMALDWAVRAVALDWRDFGEEQALERLQFELDNQGIGPWVADEDCALANLEDDTARAVSCRWTAHIEVPGSDLVIPLHFESTATIAGGGDIL